MKSLVLICAILAASYFGWRHFNKPKELEPREKVELVLNQEIIPSNELAEICSEYPQICEELLKNQKIQVSGVVQSVLVKGVSSQDLSIELAGAKGFRVSLTSDVNRAARMNQLAPEGRLRFEKNGREIIVYNQSRSRLELDGSPPSEESHGPRIFLREMETATLEAVFRHLKNNAVVLEWRQPGHLQ
jgi:hypothetical protein